MSLNGFLLNYKVIFMLGLVYGAVLQSDNIRIYTIDNRGAKNRVENVQGIKILPSYGQTLTIVCQAPGHSTWSKSAASTIPTGNPTSNVGLFQSTSTSATEQRLHIIGFRKSYRGLYSCSFGLESKHIILENRPPIGKEVEIYETHRDVTFGERLTIRAFVYGFDPLDSEVSYLWFHNDELIGEDDSNIVKTSRFNFEYTLTLLRVSQSDLGAYAFEARSDVYTSRDQITLQSSKRVDIEGVRDGISVLESAGSVSVCMKILGYEEGDSARVILQTLNSGSATPEFDFKPYRREYFIQSGERECAKIEILQNGVVSGPIPRTFSVQLQPASGFSDIGVGTFPLTIKIIDSDNITIGYKQPILMAKKGIDVRPCITITAGTLAPDLTVSFSPILPDGVVPTVIQAFGENFEISHDSSTSCIRLKPVQDNFIDETRDFNLKLSNPNSISVNYASEHMTIKILRTNGVKIRIKGGKLRREVLEGNFKSMNEERICMELFNVKHGLRRHVVVSMRTRGVTANAENDYVSVSNRFTFLPGAMVSAEICFNTVVRGDNVKEGNETYQVVLSTEPPDKFPPRRNGLLITIVEDGDKENCRQLTDLENGQIILNGTKYYDRAYYKCNPGYSNFPPGAYYRACGGSDWVGTTPECRKSCEQLVLDGSSIMYSGAGLPAFIGTVAIIQCSALWRRIGPSSRICEQEGWSGNYTYCEEITCPPLRDPLNGIVTYAKVLPRSIAVFHCNKGYRINGRVNQLTCLDVGLWDGVEPVCTSRVFTPSHSFIAFLLMAFSMCSS